MMKPCDWMAAECSAGELDKALNVHIGALFYHLRGVR